MRKPDTFIRQLIVVLGLMLAFSTMGSHAQAITQQEEIDLGKRIDAEILKQEPQITDKAALKEINDLGEQIVKNGGLKRPDLGYHFRILRDDDLNAFSTPGGYVYFTDHMWNILRHDERAGVLAHEIVHADRRHALDALLKAQRRSLILGGLLAVIGANQSIGSLVDLANQLYTLKYSRGDERQADEIGVQYLHNAGLNPAGLLLSMRKIERFEDERGGRQPTILATHPPTPEREKYLEEDLRKLGVPIPPDTVKDIPNPNQIGSVTALSDNKIEFTSTKPLQKGDTVWLMAKGWDYYYENHTAVPVARGVVTATGKAYAATIYPMSTAKPKDIVKGAAIYAPPPPETVTGVARIASAATDSSGIPRLIADGKVKKFERFLAVSTVWDPKGTKLINDSVAYVVITDPASPTGYVIAGRPKYSYAPPSAGAELVPLSDPEAGRWIGPILSIGRGGGTIEVLPSRPIEANKTYMVVAPAWEKKNTHNDRLMGTATLQSTAKKIVLKMTSFNPGWSINDIQVGYDVYEEAPKPAKK